MTRTTSLRHIGALVGLTAVYFAAGKFGLDLASVHPSASAVWPPSGIALSALLILGYEVWPAVFMGAFLVNLTTFGSPLTSVGIALGNTLEGLVGAYLVNRFANGSQAFARTRDIFRFTALAALASTTLSATIGITSLALGGFARWADFGSIWLTWWLGDATGVLIVAPVVLLWGIGGSPRVTGRRMGEAVALLAGLSIVTLFVFGGLFPGDTKTYPLEFLCIPFFLWAAFRFGRRAAATAIVVLSIIALWGTLQGFGPFAREARNDSLLLLQAFMSATALIAATLAAAVTERRRVEAQLRHLAVTDPLTGIANYRRLIQVLEQELSRSARTMRPFAVLLLDVDNLKKINDRHGHLVGSRALCRVADAMRGTCRTIDTAARYGGDEFALILPETEDAAARQVAGRVAARLSGDGEQPPVSVSVGVAVYPRDGNAVEALLGAADEALYGAKATFQAGFPPGTPRRG
jgi:diguanylate cyclase (GGDEF)-like protein